MNKYNMRELDTLRAMVDILKEGSVGNQAVFNLAGKLPTDQSNWGQLIVQEALELAIDKAVDLVNSEVSNETN
jgi:hypothetical protein